MEITARSPLWHPRFAHTLIHALASSEISWIVARHAGAEAADRKSRIKRKSRLRRGPRLFQPTEKSQSSGKKEMGAREIPVGVYSPAMPGDRFLVSAELRFGDAHPTLPQVGACITRTEA